MKYISKKYEQQLGDLARGLVRPERFGDVALNDTVAFEPVVAEAPWVKHGLRLCEPAEHGFERDPGYTPPSEAA